MAKITDLVRFDWFIKYMLRDKSNYEILEGFLSELLKEDILIVDILESEGNKNQRDDKFNRVDILVKNSKDELLIIEVQNEKEIDFMQRLLYGTSKATVEYIKEGSEYATLKKVISISIVHFDIGQGRDYLYRGTTKFMGVHEHDELQLSQEQKDFFQKSEVSDIFPEYYLIKTRKFNEIINDTLDEWIYFFKTSKIKSTFKARGLKQAQAKLSYAKLSSKKRKEYDEFIEQEMENASWALTQRVELDTARKESREEGREEGREEKDYENKVNFVKTLLINTDFDAPKIALLASVSIEFVEEVKRKIKKD
jgi:predicted transposase/invertase (TIGR01784 family)